MNKSKSKESLEFLSSIAVDYYKRHGKSRGIERYFRGVEEGSLRKLKKAASDGSLQSLHDDEDKYHPADKARSMEELKGSSSDSESSSEEVIHVADEAVQVSSSAKNESEPTKVNVNIESKVDVNMTPAPHQEVLSNTPIPNIYPTYIFPQAPPPQAAPPVIQKILYSMETQTSDVNEEPIEPLITPLKVPPPKEDTSPNSSIASKDQKLEWDSMADIGYCAEDPYSVCGAGELGTSEKKALKKFFTDKGMKLSSNVVVVRNTPRKAPPIPDETPKLEPKRGRDELRDRWKAVYAKYKDKYQESGSQTTINFETPDAKSTPMSIQKSAMEKSAQTSLIDLLSKSVQVGNDDQSSSGSFVYVKGDATSNQPPKRQSREVSSLTTNESSSIAKSRSSKSSQGEFNPKETFEDELKMAIALMNSVLESKSMATKLKKSLVSKIMQKIVNLKNTTVDEGASVRSEVSMRVSSKGQSSKELSSKELSSKEHFSKEHSSKKQSPKDQPQPPPPQEASKASSRQDTLSSGKSMICYDEVASAKPSPSSSKDSSEAASKKIENLVQESLQPMTNSEIDFQLAKESRNSSSLEVVQYVKKEKLAQLLWIEKEIKHLTELKKLLVDSKIYENLNSNSLKNRSRLQTPESIANSMEQRKDDFVKHYAESQKAVAQPIYTKPYSLYPAKEKKSSPNTDSTDEFISSGSCSIPVVTLTNTTTQPYELKSAAAATQTTNSLRRSQSIVKMKADKQMQTKPQSLAYSLSFTGPPQPKSKEQQVEELDDHDFRTLREHLSEKRPRVWGQMDERNRCIKELRRLRALRNEARKKLLLLTSEEMLRERMNRLPPPPLSQKRLFSTRALKLHTLKQCQNLSEVKEKKELEIVKNLRSKNRLVAGIFNKVSFLMFFFFLIF